MLFEMFLPAVSARLLSFCFFFFLLFIFFRNVFCCTRYTHIQRLSSVRFNDVPSLPNSVGFAQTVSHNGKWRRPPGAVGMGVGGEGRTTTGPRSRRPPGLDLGGIVGGGGGGGGPVTTTLSVPTRRKRSRRAVPVPGTKVRGGTPYNNKRSDRTI